MLTQEQMEALKEGRIYLDRDNLAKVNLVSDWVDEAVRYLLDSGVPISLALEIELITKLLIGSFYAYRWREPIQQARSIAKFLRDFAESIQQLADLEEANQ